MRTLGLLMLAMVVLTWAGCSSPPKQAQETATESRSVEQLAWEEIAKGAPIIDVRTDAEFQAGHLPNSINIPYDEITSRLNELPADRNQPVVLYCRSGRRSGIAKDSLEQRGFTRAINAGGYEALMRARPK